MSKNAHKVALVSAKYSTMSWNSMTDILCKTGFPVESGVNFCGDSDAPICRPHLFKMLSNTFREMGQDKMGV